GWLAAVINKWPKNSHCHPDREAQPKGDMLSLAPGKKQVLRFAQDDNPNLDLFLEPICRDASDPG
ncbi:MAG: hypothetical protein WBW12_17555, partial [Terriglobales bacterium]